MLFLHQVLSTTSLLIPCFWYSRLIIRFIIMQLSFKPTTQPPEASRFRERFTSVLLPSNLQANCVAIWLIRRIRKIRNPCFFLCFQHRHDSQLSSQLASHHHNRRANLNRFDTLQAIQPCLTSYLQRLALLTKQIKY